jgi:hypothetical protein
MKTKYLIADHELNVILPQHVADSDIVSYLENLCGYTFGDLYNNINTYSQMQGTYSGPSNPVKPTKYFIIEKDDNIGGNFTYSQLNSDLPDTLKAKSDAELNTLVQIEDSKYQSGTYTNGSPAYTVELKITVFDMKSKKVIDQTTMSAAPPNSTYNSSGASGTLSYDQVFSYLKNLAGYTGN